MAIDGITPAGTNFIPDSNQIAQNDEAAINQNSSDATVDNQAVTSPEEAGESRNDSPSEERSGFGAAESRSERENEVQFSNSDGDTATITRQGREASQITANQPV